MRCVPRYTAPPAGDLCRRGCHVGVGAILVAGARFAHINDISMTAGVAWSKFFRHGPPSHWALRCSRLFPRRSRETEQAPREKRSTALRSARRGHSRSVRPPPSPGCASVRRGLDRRKPKRRGTDRGSRNLGVTVPLTAAAAGGTVGVALWFTPDPDSTRAHQRRARAILPGSPSRC